MQLWDTGEALGWLLITWSRRTFRPEVQARQALGSLMVLGVKLIMKSGLTVSVPES
ncbi:hypothetical protein ACLBOM_33140 [Escherichia coli]